MKTYTFYMDGGHGWLAVPVSELDALGIRGDVSGYSYLRGGTVYLEEDCDAPRFLQAKFGDDHVSARAAILEVDHGDRSRIRNYPAFA